ncbi:MAG: undecaprenyl-diphosphate phosphatase [Deltaproteobacteria bacterium]|nr:MAG: undecaprenyl-diphosphate phosphatase [Deltaproteobacteria bacterium]
MLWLMVIALAALQGLTEFLPVSSSGHLRLLAEAFGVEEPQTLFDIMLHVGTLVAVFIVYRALFWRMITAIGRALRRPAGIRAQIASDADLRLFVFATIGTVPTGIIAIALGDQMEALAANVGAVGAALIVNAGILFVLRALTIGRWQADAAHPRRPIEQLRLSDALLIGTAQGFGIIRGISRSGSTITAGILTGLEQQAAAAFSFVLAVPAILGALAMHLKDGGMSGDGLAHALVGAVVAAVVGTIALLLLLRLLRQGRLHLFGWYCLALGTAAVLWEIVGV